MVTIGKVISIFIYFKDGDIYCCVADCGWITGHTYIVYGPLLNGATTVMFESIPTYPNPYRFDNGKLFSCVFI